MPNTLWLKRAQLCYNFEHNSYARSLCLLLAPIITFLFLVFVLFDQNFLVQVPQAVGAAYAFKRKNNKQVVATFFGDGGSSSGDTHVGMNFASVYDVPIIFVW